MTGDRREERAVEWDGGRVTSVWHHPVGPVRGGLLLAHGAGGNLHSPQIRRLADALMERGVTVVRFNFPYSEVRRKTPDRQPLLEACYRAVIAAACARMPNVFAGGRSMGGRIASHVAAAGGSALAGLVFLAYPLHPPGKPERPRDAHLPDVAMPMLFVQGTRDSFARWDLLQATLARLPRATLHALEGADHGFKVPGRPEAEVLEEIVDVVAGWIGDGGET